MRAFRLLLRHELGLLLISPGTYIAAVLFLVVMGFLFLGMVSSFTAEPQEAPPIAVFFRFFVVPVLFLVPLLTMRSLAEERRAGTLETLLTAPVSPAAVVLSKYVAAWSLYALLWLGTLGFHVALYSSAGDPRLMEAGPLVSGYSFILSTGALFIAIGILSSAVARSQLVAAVLTFAALFLLIVGVSFGVQEAKVSGATVWLPWLEAVDFAAHSEDFFAGLIDFRPLVLSLSAAALLVFLSVILLETKWGRR